MFLHIKNNQDFSDNMVMMGNLDEDERDNSNFLREFTDVVAHGCAYFKFN